MNKDTELRNKVFFLPWVGENYKKGIDGKKILVLGESHICGCCDDPSVCGDLSITDESCRNFTSHVAIDDYFNYKKGLRKSAHWMNTFTKFGNVFYNEWLCPEDSLEFWNSIIFYNYVQYSTEQARVSPKDKEFTNSENAFFAVLEKYNPDIIIAWGKRLWKNLPSNGFYKTLDDEETSINDGKGLYYYRIGNKDIPIFYVYHPSSSHFTYDSHSVLKEAFDKIAETK